LFLLTVSLLPYWVNVMATYPNNSAATGLFVLWMGVAQVAFLLLCLLVRRELAAGAALDELIVPKVIRAGNAAVMFRRARRAAGRPGAGARRAVLGVAAAARGRGPLSGARVVGPPWAPDG
jgi:hypothetical protein